MFLLIWIVLSTSGYFLLNVILNLNSDNKLNENMPKKNLLLYALPSFVVGIIYLLVFYPGNVPNDTMWQWSQATKFQFDDWHPVMHSMLMAFLMRVWHTPACIALFQIICLSITLGYSAYTLEKINAPKVFIWVWLGIIAIFPINGIYSVTILKDTMFNIWFMFFSIILFNIYIYSGKWLDNKKNIMVFFIAIMGTLLMRHNGIYILLIFLPIYLFCQKVNRKKIAIIFSLSFIVYFIITIPIYKLLNVTPGLESEKYSVPVNVMAAIVKDGNNVTDEQKKQISDIMPIEIWKDKYNPILADPIKSELRQHQSKYLENKVGFFTLLTKLSIQNPKQALKGYAAITNICWNISDRSSIVRAYIGISPVRTELKNDKSLVSSSKMPQLKNVLISCINWKRFDIVWRPALYFFIVVFCSIILILKKGFKSIAFLIPFYLNIILFMLTIPAQTFRYLYVNYLIAGFVVILTVYCANYRRDLS